MAEKERYLRMVKAGENNPSKYRISKPSEILDELDLNIGAISDSFDEAEDLADVVEERRTSREIEAA